MKRQRHPPQGEGTSNFERAQRLIDEVRAQVKRNGLHGKALVEQLRRNLRELDKLELKAQARQRARRAP